MTNLTDGQLAFAREYVALNNGTKAAKRAGYSEKTAHAQASRLLRNAKVVAEISRLRAFHAARLNITVDEITRKLTEDRDLAHREGQAGAAVSASSALAKLHGLMVDRREVKVVSTLTDDEVADELAQVKKELEEAELTGETTRH